jgi:hypothetical protein
MFAVKKQNHRSSGDAGGVVVERSMDARLKKLMESGSGAR